MHRMYEQWHPLGIVGVISSFNFPVAVWSWNAFIAAICGNVTVWKPSSKCPLCGIAVQNICNQALEEGGFPPIFLSFMDSSHELANRFVEDERVPLLSFTGSTRVGRNVGARVAQRFGMRPLSVIWVVRNSFLKRDLSIESTLKKLKIIWPLPNWKNSTLKRITA